MSLLKSDELLRAAVVPQLTTKGSASRLLSGVYTLTVLLRRYVLHVKDFFFFTFYIFT